MVGSTIDRAVVIGGSIAGLAAAAALAERVGEVLVVERRPLPTTDAPASIAPQGEFPHILLASGAASLDRLLPGFTDDLFAHGAIGRDDLEYRGHWWAVGAVRHVVPHVGMPVPMCSRALVESRLRDRVRRLPNVTFEQTVVRGLRLGGDRVVGVEVEHGHERTALDADLVVDASGRGSHAATWLKELGLREPPVSRVDIGLTYTAVDVRRSATDIDGGRFAVVQNTRTLPRMGVALSAEGDRWKIAIGSYFGDAAPATRDGILQYAASLPDPVILQLLENEWLTEPAQHRFPSSLRRRWERVRDLPAGFCAVGDAVASFNPLYGQGMSSGVLQAEALKTCLGREGSAPRLPSAVQRAAAKVVANPWRIATGGDFVYPSTKGSKAPGTDLVNSYMERVFVAAAADPDVNVALNRVTQLLDPPTSLLAPDVVRRVIACTRGRRAAPLPVR